MNLEEQECLIHNTLPITEEVIYMNELLENQQYEYIYVYGKNYMDRSINKKYEQLISLGFKNVYIYVMDDDKHDRILFILFIVVVIVNAIAIR